VRSNLDPAGIAANRATDLAPAINSDENTGGSTAGIRAQLDDLSGTLEGANLLPADAEKESFGKQQNLEKHFGNNDRYLLSKETARVTLWHHIGGYASSHGGEIGAPSMFSQFIREQAPKISKDLLLYNRLCNYSHRTTKSRQWVLSLTL
jgi:hypothetical protein